MGVATYLANHEYLVGLGKFGKLFERRHETLVVVSTASSVDEDDVVALLCSVGDCVLGHGGSVLAVALLVELNLTAAFPGCEFLEVADVDGELLDGAGAKRVTCGDKDLVFVLQEEEANLG